MKQVCKQIIPSKLLLKNNKHLTTKETANAGYSNTSNITASPKATNISPNEVAQITEHRRRGSMLNRRLRPSPS
jgi:hypothetical protein